MFMFDLLNEFTYKLKPPKNITTKKTEKKLQMCFLERKNIGNFAQAPQSKPMKEESKKSV